MHVISGTHWDREWRYTAEQSKVRLVNLIDSLINILENKSSYHSFLLDGGTVILEDYLSIRPENKERIKKLIKEKRIFLVNWYTLPDMFTVAPESILRNILIGQEMGNQFGGCMKTGYTATSYGQVAQLPQIYNKFGIDSIYFYRGLNKYVVPPCFLWEAPEGSKLLGIRGFDVATRTNWFFYVHQPLVLNKEPIDTSYQFQKENLPVHLADEYSYEQGFQMLKENYNFNHDKKALKQAFNNIYEYTNWQNIGSHLLALNIEDNQIPYEQLPEVIAELNKVSENVEIVQDSWDNFINEVKNDIPEKSLKTYKGEFRHTAVEWGWNGLLGAVLSSRINLKLLNEKAETELIYSAEPFASIASAMGYEYPVQNFIRIWKSLLQNHAHDSICGAAIDQAHKDMLYRFSFAQTVAQEISKKSIEKIWQNIDFSKFNDNDFTLTVFNTLLHNREEVVPAVVDLPKKLNIKYFDLIDLKGKKIPYEILSKQDISVRIDNELDSPGLEFPAERMRLLFQIKVPAMGYTSIALRPRGPQYACKPDFIPDRKLIASPEGTLENKYLKININPNGTLKILDKKNNFAYQNLHFFADNGEIGSAHGTYTPLRDFLITSKGCNARIILIENNSLRGIFKIELNMRIPAGATLDGQDRVKEIIDLPITYRITLKKDSNRIEFKTRLINNSRDHRLRVLFPTGLKTDSSYAETPFMIVKRSILWKETGDNIESHFPFQPMQNFVDVTDEKKGMAFLSKGLREYEVIDDKQRTLAITLLRTHRAYMMANSNMTPEELDKYKGSHQIGELEYNYALYFHEGDWNKGEVLKESYLHKVPAKIMQGVKNKGKLAPESNFFEIMPADKVMLSALKKSEDGKGILLRLWNPFNQSFDLKIKTGFKFAHADKVMLNEKKIKAFKFTNNTLEVPMKKHEILTLIFR